jgi:DNA-binding winged helix-turn-helix (wHTH) protein
MTDTVRLVERQPAVDKKPRVELFLGRLGTAEAESAFIHYSADNDVPLGELIEFAMERPPEDSEGLLLWVRRDPTVPEELMLEDIILADGRVVINQLGRELIVDGVSTTLTNKQWGLLKVLADEIGRVVPREKILQECWGTEYISEGIIRVNLLPIRKVLGEHRELIVTKKSKGYMLDDQYRPQS